MSGRSCSAACAVFFDCQATPVEELPERAEGRLQAMLFQQLRLHLSERDVAVSVDQALQISPMRIELGALRLVFAMWSRSMHLCIRRPKISSMQR